MARKGLHYSYRRAVKSTNRAIDGLITKSDLGSRIFYSFVADGSNPKLTPLDINSDPHVEFVADPFIIKENGAGRFHLFFEIKCKGEVGKIGHAFSETAGKDWTYTQIVLNEMDHLSFPFVFSYRDDYYMIPEVGGLDGTKIVLYTATNFPTKWEPVGVLIDADHPVGDSVLFRHDGYWWLITGHQHFPTMAYFNSELTIDGWAAHRDNPIIPESHHTRPAGRPITHDGETILLFQDCHTMYGERVVPYQLLELTQETYKASRVKIHPALQPSKARLEWNGGRMHHVDSQWIDDEFFCVVDGDPGYPNLLGERWTIGQYRLAHVTA